MLDLERLQNLLDRARRHYPGLDRKDITCCINRLPGKAAIRISQYYFPNCLEIEVDPSVLRCGDDDCLVGGIAHELSHCYTHSEPSVDSDVEGRGLGREISAFRKWLSENSKQEFYR